MNTCFDWSLVRSFLAVLDQGSLLGAARQLGSSQPTIGRHVAELESQLATTLFERTGRGLRPTGAALRLADSARVMQAGADQLLHSATGAATSTTGTVRITASQPMACFVLPAVLTQMRQVLPQIQVELVATNAVSNLLKREADIAIRMVRPHQQTVVARKIGQVALRACGHQDYLRRRGVPREAADLLHHELIGGDRNQDIVKGFAARGFSIGPAQFALKTDDLIVVWQAVRAGLGIGFVSEHLIRTDPAVIALLPHLRIEPLPLWLAVHREVRTQQRIRAVYDFLSDALPRAI